MPQDHDDLSPAVGQSAPTSAGFDRAFTAVAASPGIRRVWELAESGLPPQVEPLSFVTVGLLRYVARALDLSPGQTLADLGCGRGGPGLWLAREADVSLAGVDFSPVAVGQATRRAALFGLDGRARFVVGDLARTGLPDASADAVVSIDAFHFAADPVAAAREVRRVLRPGRRLVLTNWQPKVPDDPRLPGRKRIDWPRVLRGAGFAGVEMEARPEWHAACCRVLRVALDLGDPGDDASLADLQDEARTYLPLADLMHRVAVTATAPALGVVAGLRLTEPNELRKIIARISALRVDLWRWAGGDEPLTDELPERRAAVAELAAELRVLADLLTRTEVGADVLRDSAQRLREVAPALRECVRGLAEPASVDDLMGGVRMFNPVIGAGNPIAPPLRIEVGEDGVQGWCTLGHAYEGPPMYGHGGVSAMLIDQLLGHAAAAVGHPGLTAELTVRYRRPVPLDVPLRVWGRVTSTEGRRVSAVGGITTAGEPDVPLVEAEARFARLRLDQARRLFSRLASPDADNPDVAHD